MTSLATILAELDDLLDIEDGLSTWEVDFIDDMNKKRADGFTDKQAKKIDELWDRHCK